MHLMGFVSISEQLEQSSLTCISCMGCKESIKLWGVYAKVCVCVCVVHLSKSQYL